VRCSTSFNSMPSFCRRWIAFGHEARLSGAIEDERYAARVFRRFVGNKRRCAPFIAEIVVGIEHRLELDRYEGGVHDLSLSASVKKPYRNC